MGEVGESQARCDKGKYQFSCWIITLVLQLYRLTSAGDAPVLVPRRRWVRGGAGRSRRRSALGCPGGRALWEERLYKLAQLWNLGNCQ